MAELFTPEQARAWLRANNLKTGKSIQDAFINEIKGVLQEALEEEMNNTLGYSKYDYTNKNNDNSRNGHTKKTVKSQFGKIKLDIPRDADGEHEAMMKKDQSFKNVRNTDTLTRLARSAGIRILNRFEYFEAVNGKNGHRYRVQIRGQDIICSCPDAKSHNCKHEIAVARDLDMFMEVVYMTASAQVNHRVKEAMDLLLKSFDEDNLEKVVTVVIDRTKISPAAVNIPQQAAACTG